MHEIMMSTYELIDELDKSDIIKNLLYYKELVLNNKYLLDLINKGKNTSDKYLIISIRRELYSNSDYKNYIDYYNKLNYIVMEINNRYKKLLNINSCINI